MGIKGIIPFATLQQSHYNDLINDTIYDALASQIILKTIAYLDEWNNYFGVITEIKDNNKILKIKQIAKPAYSILKEWKDLNNYRNHTLAHNHRDKKKQNVYLNNTKYDIPGSNGELFLLCYCVNKMSQVVSSFFQDEVLTVISVLGNIINRNRIENTENASISSNYIEKIKSMDNMITDRLMQESSYNSSIYAMISKTE